MRHGYQVIGLGHQLRGERPTHVPAQVGTHNGSNRKTYGHSLVVAPWGEVLADAGGEKAGFVVAEIDFGKVEEARRMVPSGRRTPIECAPGKLVSRTSPLGRNTQPATCWSVAATRSC